MKKLLRFDWDVIAGIAAAVIAIVLHLLHVVDTGVLFTITLVLLALLLIRDLRRESQDEHVAETLTQLKSSVQDVRLSLETPDAILIGPRHLRAESQRFVESAQGDMIWFNVCFLMFRTQEVFDLLLRPAIENPHVKSIQFVSDRSEQDLWDQYMAPKIRECSGSRKVAKPCWRDLPQTVSFILGDDNATGKPEALLSFWGDPFMSKSTGKQVPRYIFRIQSHSDLVAQFIELERHHRLQGDECSE